MSTETTGAAVWQEPARSSSASPAVVALTGLERLRTFLSGRAPLPPIARLVGRRLVDVGKGTCGAVDTARVHLLHHRRAVDDLPRAASRWWGAAREVAALREGVHTASVRTTSQLRSLYLPNGALHGFTLDYPELAGGSAPAQRGHVGPGGGAHRGLTPCTSERRRPPRSAPAIWPSCADGGVVPFPRGPHRVRLSWPGRPMCRRFFEENVLRLRYGTAGGGMPWAPPATAGMMHPPGRRRR
jgi:hypothetical protein